MYIHTCMYAHMHFSIPYYCVHKSVHVHKRYARVNLFTSPFSTTSHATWKPSMPANGTSCVSSSHRTTPYDQTSHVSDTGRHWITLYQYKFIIATHVGRIERESNNLHFNPSGVSLEYNTQSSSQGTATHTHTHLFYFICLPQAPSKGTSPPLTF